MRHERKSHWATVVQEIILCTDILFIVFSSLDKHTYLVNLNKLGIFHLFLVKENVKLWTVLMIYFIPCLFNIHIAFCIFMVSTLVRS